MLLSSLLREFPSRWLGIHSFLNRCFLNVLFDKVVL
jgi:hypothetical protein